MPRLLAVLLALTLIAAACGGSDTAGGGDDTAGGGDDTADETPTSTTTTTTSTTTTSTTTSTTTTVVPLAEIEPVGDGPYAIGTVTLTVTDTSRDRVLPVQVWFPLADGTTGDAARYSFVTGDYFDSPRALDVGFDAASPDGPFPLVVYSHGSGGLRFIHSDYTETLAGHGYVVVAPDHPGNTAVERVLGSSDAPEVIAYNRPLDVEAVIDAVLDPDDPETTGLAALIDADSIAVTGHSFGGFTTLAVASGYTNPEGTVPADPRIDALIPLAPAVGDGTGLLSTDVLAAIDIPTLVMVGTDDKTTPVDPNVETIWDDVSASPLYRLELVAGEHQSFTDLCDYLDVLPDRPDANPLVVNVVTEMGAEGCSAGDMPIDRVKELTNTFAVTFLDSVFRGGEMITPDGYAIPDDILFAAK